MTDDKLYMGLSANTIMANLTNHVQQTNFITSMTDKYYSLDSEDDFCSGCQNVSHQQQFFSELYPHPDDHTIWATDTPGFKPFTMTSNNVSCRARESCLLCRKHHFFAQCIKTISFQLKMFCSENSVILGNRFVEERIYLPILLW